MPVRISPRLGNWSATVIRWGWRKLLTLLNQENIRPKRTRIRQDVLLPGGIQLSGYSTELTTNETKPAELQELELRRWEGICRGRFAADLLAVARRGVVIQTIVWSLDREEDHVLMLIRKG